MNTLALFEEKQVRRAWNQAEEKWYFAIVDVIAILTGSDNPQVYWRVMKKRLSDEGNETVTNCNALKMTAADGKQCLTDVVDVGADSVAHPVHPFTQSRLNTMPTRTGCAHFPLAYNLKALGIIRHFVE